MTNTLGLFLHSKMNYREALKNRKYYNAIKSSNLFDEEYYKKEYDDVKGDALTHYLTVGYLDGRNPSPDFDANFYYDNYPDVGAAQINPLLHYIAHGKDEGKIIQSAYAIRRKEEICESNLPYLANYSFDEEPLVSIIILNRNGLTHLERLFSNFRENTNYSNYEIIVVDNASSDDSVNYLKSLDLPITVVENKENVSFSKGNNDAAKIANGKYLLLLNNDIETTYGWLNEMVGAMVNNEDVASVGAKLVFPYYNNILNRSKSFKIQHSGDIFAERMRPCCLYAINKSNNNLNIFDKSLTRTAECISVTAAVTLIDKSVYEELGGLDEDYYYGLEDVDFCLKSNKKGYKTLFAGNALLFHHESSTRVIDKAYVENDKRNYKIFWSKWGSYLSKNLLVDKIHDNNFFSEKSLKITIIDDKFENHLEFLSNISKEFNKRGFTVELISNLENSYIGNSSDILLSLSPDYDLSQIISRLDIVKAFVVSDDVDADLTGYDILVSDDEDKLDKFDSECKILIESNDFAFEFLVKLEEIIRDCYEF